MSNIEGALDFSVRWSKGSEFTYEIRIAREGGHTVLAGKAKVGERISVTKDDLSDKMTLDNDLI